MRDGRWKLVLGNGSGGRQAPRGEPFARPYQLFDLSRGPGEAHDVAAEHPEVVARLEATLRRFRREGRPGLGGNSPRNSRRRGRVTRMGRWPDGAGRARKPHRGVSRR